MRLPPEHVARKINSLYAVATEEGQPVKVHFSKDRGNLYANVAAGSYSCSMTRLQWIRYGLPVLIPFMP